MGQLSTGLQQFRRGPRSGCLHYQHPQLLIAIVIPAVRDVRRAVNNGVGTDLPFLIPYLNHSRSRQHKEEHIDGCNMTSKRFARLQPQVNGLYGGFVMKQFGFYTVWILLKGSLIQIQSLHFRLHYDYV